MAILKSVLTKPFPLAGIVQSYADDKSKPAANWEPLTGKTANSDNFLTYLILD